MKKVLNGKLKGVRLKKVGRGKAQKVIRFKRTLTQMQNCKDEGYKCKGPGEEVCEWYEDCAKATNWECPCCGKKASYQNAYDVIFN